MPLREIGGYKTRSKIGWVSWWWYVCWRCAAGGTPAPCESGSTSALMRGTEIMIAPRRQDQDQDHMLFSERAGGNRSSGYRMRCKKACRGWMRHLVFVGIVKWSICGSQSISRYFSIKRNRNSRRQNCVLPEIVQDKQGYHALILSDAANEPPSHAPPILACARRLVY